MTTVRVICDRCGTEIPEADTSKLPRLRIAGLEGPVDLCLKCGQRYKDVIHKFMRGDR
jgi:hypothetical protein